MQQFSYIRDHSPWMIRFKETRAHSCSLFLQLIRQSLISMLVDSELELLMWMGLMREGAFSPCLCQVPQKPMLLLLVPSVIALVKLLLLMFYYLCFVCYATLLCCYQNRYGAFIAGPSVGVGKRSPFYYYYRDDRITGPSQIPNSSSFCIGKNLALPFRQHKYRSGAHNLYLPSILGERAGSETHCHQVQSIPIAGRLGLRKNFLSATMSALSPRS